MNTDGLPDGWHWEVVSNFWRKAAWFFMWFYLAAGCVLFIIASSVYGGRKEPVRYDFGDVLGSVTLPAEGHYFTDTEVLMPFTSGVAAILWGVFFGCVAAGLPLHVRRITKTIKIGSSRPTLTALGQTLAGQTTEAKEPPAGLRAST